MKRIYEKPQMTVEEYHYDYRLMEGSRNEEPEGQGSGNNDENLHGL